MLVSRTAIDISRHSNCSTLWGASESVHFTITAYSTVSSAMGLFQRRSVPKYRLSRGTQRNRTSQNTTGRGSTIIQTDALRGCWDGIGCWRSTCERIICSHFDSSWRNSDTYESAFDDSPLVVDSLWDRHKTHSLKWINRSPLSLLPAPGFYLYPMHRFSASWLGSRNRTLEMLDLRGTIYCQVPQSHN